jgi:hypothetical protein
VLTAAPLKLRKVRTPLGVVPEPDGTFTIFFTGYTRADSWGEVWMLRVKVEEQEKHSQASSMRCCAGTGKAA